VQTSSNLVLGNFSASIGNTNGNRMKASMIAIVAAVVVIAALVLTRPEGADVAQARKETQAAIAHAKIVESDNRILKMRADSALAVASDYEKKAVVAAANLTVAKKDLFKAALAAPDTCAPVVLAAQVALSESDKLVDIRTHELAAALAADSADRKRADDAEAALRDLRKPAQALVTASKPSIWRRLRPELQAGGMAGVDVSGKPNAVIGIGLGWHF
jgi:hypothetical protein